MKRKVLGVAFLLFIQSVALGQFTALGATAAVAQTFGVANSATTTAQPSYAVKSDTQITATVPTGAIADPVAVTTPGGIATSPTSFTATATAGDWTATYSVGATPINWAPGQTQSYSVTITNNGIQTWPAGGSNPVQLSVHFANTALNYWYTDQRFSLPADLASGSNVTLSIAVTAPTNTGNLVLEYQMVKQSQFWFSQVADVNVTVNATVAPPHIMLIVMENKAYSSAQGTPYVIGASQAPYINNTLVKNYTSATNWFAVEHNSPLDYYDLISGSDQSSAKKPYTATTLVDELNGAKIPWKAYMEGMPSNCYNGLPVGLYDPIHNPLAPFSDYKSLCNGTNGVVPYTGPFSSSQMKIDLNSAAPPAFVFFSPNICDDMHTNGTPCGPNGVANGDTWLSTFIPGVQATNWYATGGIIIITWDESVSKDTSGGTYGTGGQVPTLVISGNPKGSFTPSGDHYAVLRGIEEVFGVGLLGNSANASFGDLKPAF